MSNSLTTVIPFTSNHKDARDPSTLIGLHVKAGSNVGEFEYPYVIQTVEEGVVHIELHLSGRYHTLHLDHHLYMAIEAATNHKPVKIVEAVFGRRSIDVRWPKWCWVKDLRGKIVKEEFDVIGLRLENMTAMGWIWGEDDIQEFHNSGLYADAYVSLDKEPWT
ncbi:MAG: hypothetical protein Q9208_006107 [Pyrenodesmia sp. 3 TL-2023]